MPSNITPQSRVNRRTISEGSGLRSNRDKDSVSQQWKATNNASLNGGYLANTLQKLVRDVLRLRRVRPGGFIPQVIPPVMFPFKIYQMDNFQDGSKSNFTFQIRGGLVGFRSNYGIAGFDTYQGNWELPLVACGTDSETEGFNAYFAYASGASSYDFEKAPTQNTGAILELDAGGDATLIYDSTAFVEGGVQVVVPQSISEGQILADFWVRLVDDPTKGPYSQLWGKAAGSGGFSPSSPPFSRDFSPNLFSEVTFAVGNVFYGSPTAEPIVSQAQTSHLLNRFLELPPLPIKPTISPLLNQKFKGVAQVQRGYWKFNGLDSIDGGVAMYPSDVVIDDSTTVTIGGTNFYWSYIYNNPSPALETDAPNINANFSKYALMSATVP